jgi:hypothetical protein
MQQSSRVAAFKTRSEALINTILGDMGAIRAYIITPF